MASTSSCTIGIKLESKYQKTTYNQKIGLKNFDVFSERDEREKLVLTLRTQIEEISNICYHHKWIDLIRYAVVQRKCADLFKLGKKLHKGMTKLIQTFISNFSYFTCGNFHSLNKVVQNSN